MWHEGRKFNQGSERLTDNKTYVFERKMFADGTFSRGEEFIRGTDPAMIPNTKLEAGKNEWPFVFDLPHTDLPPTNEIIEPNEEMGAHIRYSVTVNIEMGWVKDPSTYKLISISQMFLPPPRYFFAAAVINREEDCVREVTVPPSCCCTKNEVSSAKLAVAIDRCCFGPGEWVFAAASIRNSSNCKATFAVSFEMSASLAIKNRGKRPVKRSFQLYKSKVINAKGTFEWKESEPHALQIPLVPPTFGGRQHSPCGTSPRKRISSDLFMWSYSLTFSLKFISGGSYCSEQILHSIPIFIAPVPLPALMALSPEYMLDKLPMRSNQNLKPQTLNSVTNIKLPKKAMLINPDYDYPYLMDRNGDALDYSTARKYYPKCVCYGDQSIPLPLDRDFPSLDSTGDTFVYESDLSYVVGDELLDRDSHAPPGTDEMLRSFYCYESSAPPPRSDTISNDSDSETWSLW